MFRSATQLRDDALGIWQAGVRAVDSRRLMADNVRVARSFLEIGAERIPLSEIRRIVVVGAGKAGAGMAEGLEAVLGESLMAAKQLAGLVNVPEDCVRELRRIRLHGARPAGVICGYRCRSTTKYSMVALRTSMMAPMTTARCAKDEATILGR